MTDTSLSIFLLKAGRVQDAEAGIGELNAAQVPLAPPLEGFFVPFEPEERTPAWVSAVTPLLTPTAAPVGLQSLTPSGLLFVRRGGRTFVLSFGHAWMRLRAEWVEHDFGRRVALNSMREDSLLELRTEQVFAKWHLANERAPRGSTVDSFGVEFDRDMVSVVEGLSTVTAFGKLIRGGTSLRVKADIAQIGALLDRALTEFASARYKSRWPDIDNLTTVTDPTVISALEGLLDADLAAGAGARKLTLFTPQQRKGEIVLVSAYVIGRLGRTATRHPYLMFGTWAAFATARGKALTCDVARETIVHLLDDDGDELGECSVFECLGYEASLAGKAYILSSGIWYEVVTAFLTRTNTAVRGIPVPAIPLAAWNQTDDEGVYNASCAADPAFLLFDKRDVWYGGGRSQFEFCDLMHPATNRLYFVKIASKSSGMSHLIEQVRRTVELFFGPDQGFRDALRLKILRLDATADVTWTASRPRPGEWRLCFVSMGRTATKLPFFARCSLANAYRDLRRAGHEVEFLTV